ncbi:hypothetical protein [Mesobacillus jeotgali]|uniref:Uncharacterized protein n=1 Tax=Mesobacillus jeotgali TaxID=129985 RepID=A0ABY9VBT1_9BACI|nr:hypothetical protein [Mesobacillus jeotgali]WNF21309.1 hypothetical protein RH061_14005 [Mesobacillus jeotgali]
MPLAKYGVWTPSAGVICFKCHGPQFNSGSYNVNSEIWRELQKEQPLKKGNAITFCDKCYSAIQLIESVAEEHNMVARLRETGIDATMVQTGGMCSAGEIPISSGYYLFTYSFDGDKTWWVVEYDEEGIPVNTVEHLNTHTADAMFESLVKLMNICEKKETEPPGSAS